MAFEGPPPVMIQTRSNVLAVQIVESITVMSITCCSPGIVMCWKRKPAAGVAERVTAVPSSKTAAHAEPQSMPRGLDLTEPEPLTPMFSPNFAGPASGGPASGPASRPSTGGMPASGP